MEVQLKVLVGNNVGQVLKVPGPKFFIGRAEDCHLRPGSDLVSRHHCVLIIEGGVVALRDFGSKNGTHVNGVRIIGETPLANGDHLKVGPLEFEFQMIESLTGAKRPKVNSIKEAAVRTAESGVQHDLDLDALLGADNGDTRELRRGDTAELEVSGTDTTVITPKPVAAPPAPPPAPEPEGEPVAAEEPPAKQQGERKVIGKLSDATKKSGDSKDAAAEMLRRLRRR